MPRVPRTVALLELDTGEAPRWLWVLELFELDESVTSDTPTGGPCVFDHGYPKGTRTSAVPRTASSARAPRTVSSETLVGRDGYPLPLHSTVSILSPRTLIPVTVTVGVAWYDIVSVTAVVTVRTVLSSCKTVHRNNNSMLTNMV